MLGTMVELFTRNYSLAQHFLEFIGFQFYSLVAGVAYFNSPSTSAFLGPTSVGPDILGAVILAAASSSYKFNVHAWLE
jgi:hypothetical protein